LASCRFCNQELRNKILDLGSSPLANSNLDKESMQRMEPFYPLTVYQCSQCSLVQLESFEAPEDIFSDYVYFSSYSDSWVEHARKYVEETITKRSLDSNSQVVEIASNDGYLLQHFKKFGIPVHGVEPAENVAEFATAKDIPTTTLFFGIDTAEKLVSMNLKADIVIGNNVLAHVPDINDFVRGIKLLLKDKGLVNIEFPHLYELVKNCQFDTIYHEHFSYFSLASVSTIFDKHGLTVYDADQLETHGGSLRIYATHSDQLPARSEKYCDIIEIENSFGLADGTAYPKFRDSVINTKNKLVKYLIEQKELGNTVVGYGAPAKGNTLLNYCGIRSDLLEYTVDKNPYKQGLCLPGTRIPIYPPEKIYETKPDIVLILPWNLESEVIQQMKDIREWGAKFAVPIPEIRVIN